MNSFHRNNDEALGRALRNRFERFEPEAPNSLEAILGRVKPKQNGYSTTLIKTAILGIVFIVWLPLTPYDQLGNLQPPVEASSLNIEFDSKDVPLSNLRKSEITYLIDPDRDSGKLLALSRQIPTHSSVSEASEEGLSSTLTVNKQNSVLTPLDKNDFTVQIENSEKINPAILQESSTTTELSAVNTSDLQPLIIKRNKLSFTGSVGVTNTQYVVTLQPHHFITIRDATLPDIAKGINWKPQVNLGLDYSNWQIQLNYRAFSQRMEYWVTEGAFEVDYNGNQVQSIRAVGSNEQIMRNVQLLGLSLRKSFPLKSFHTYVGLGAGYFFSLGEGNSPGAWGQLYTGRQFSLNEKLQIFVEGQFNYSFQTHSHSDHPIYTRPYQIGLTTGLRWHKP